jgi:hypothetical protein
MTGLSVSGEDGKERGVYGESGEVIARDLPLTLGVLFGELGRGLAALGRRFFREGPGSRGGWILTEPSAKHSV